MSKLNLNDVEWKEFKIGEIFEVSKGTYLPKKNIKDGDIPYITATTLNNGITQFIGNESIFKGNSITIEKINFKAFYQLNPFYCSHDVTVLENERLNKYNGTFIANMISRQGGKYSYGKQAQLNVTKRESIFLPIDYKSNLNWDFMEQYMKQQERELLEITLDYYERTVLNNLIITGSLSDVEWAEFKFDEVFTEIRRGKRLVKKDQKEGKMPYISSKGINNGVDNFISNKENVRIYQDCLTIANSGSVGSCFYHEYEFIASDHVTHLKNEKFDKYIYLFMVPIVQRLEEKYSFNREINDTRIRKEKLLLPINDSGEINFDFMRNFMKYMEVDRLKKVINVYNKKIDKKLTGGGTTNLNWQEFTIGELFNISIGKNIDGNKVNKDSGLTVYITRKESENGVDGFIDGFEETHLNRDYPVITIGNETAKPFVQNYKFYTGTKVNILESKEPITRYTMYFITTSLEKHKSKYSYSYTATSKRLEKQKLLLPVDENMHPDWSFMDKYMRQIENEKIIKYLQKYVKHKEHL